MRDYEPNKYEGIRSDFNRLIKLQQHQTHREIPSETRKNFWVSFDRLRKTTYEATEEDHKNLCAFAEAMI